MRESEGSVFGILAGADGVGIGNVLVVVAE